MAQPVVGRIEFAGANITCQMKRALDRESSKEGTSKSLLLFRWILRELEKRGHKITDVAEELRKPGWPS